MQEQDVIDQISENILQGSFNGGCQPAESNITCSPGVPELISLSVENEIPPDMVSRDALDKTMNEIINRFTNDDYNAFELIGRAKRIGDARDLLIEHVENPDVLSKGRMVLAAVEGEYHRHGLDIVSSLSNGIGFDTIELGMGVPVIDIVNALEKHDPDYLGISAHSKSTLPKLSEMTASINKDSGNKHVKVILGGFLASDESSQNIEVDFRCHNLISTIDLLLDLVNAKN